MCAAVVLAFLAGLNFGPTAWYEVRVCGEPAYVVWSTPTHAGGFSISGVSPKAYLIYEDAIAQGNAYTVRIERGCSGDPV